MLETLQNYNTWIILGIAYLGIFFYLIGLARHQNNIISGFGILIIVGAFIYGIFKTTFIISISILIFAYLTRTIIPSYFAYLYWKLRFQAEYLTHLRFKYLVSDQDLKPDTIPPLKDIIIQTAEEKGLGESSTLEKYSQDVFNSDSKYIVNEVLGNYDLFSRYVKLRSKYNTEIANNIMKRKLGIIPLSKIEADLKMDEFHQNVRKLEKENKKDL